LGVFSIRNPNSRTTTKNLESNTNKREEMGNEKNKKSRQGNLGGASSVAKRKGGVVTDEADVCKKKKSKTYDMEEEGEISEDDCGFVGDDEADEAPDNEDTPDDEQQHQLRSLLQTTT